MAEITTLADTVWDRLNTLQEDLNLYDAITPRGPGDTYGVYYPNAGVVASDRHGGGYGLLTWGFFVVVTGVTRTQVMNGARLVRGAFTGWRPDPGESAGPLEEVDLGNDISRDDSGRLNFTLRYTLTTTRS